METSVLAAAPLKRRPVSLACCTICPLVSKVSLGWIVTADGFEPEARFKNLMRVVRQKKVCCHKKLASASVIKSERTCV